MIEVTVKVIIVSLIFSAGWIGGTVWNEISHYEDNNRTL